VTVPPDPPPPTDARVVLAAGVTRTAEIHGISAAGAAPCELALTPAADAEVLVHGDVVRAPAVPESPTGCPTPAVVTRAAVAVLGLSVTVLDAGLSSPMAADPVTLGADPGGDVREPEPVPAAPQIRTRARAVGAELDGHPVIAETIPGGTTTALSVLRALGEEFGVSSSLPDNPVERKRRVAREALSASGLSQGGCTGDPDRALRRAGDPVLAAVVGVVEGVLADRDETAAPAVTLGGGTQMLAATALLRHAGVTAPLRVATTSYVARDPTADVRDAARALDVDLVATDPGFGAHPAVSRYAAGEGKEGVGMGGVLWLADRAGRLPAVRERARSLADALGVGPTEDCPSERSLEKDDKMDTAGEKDVRTDDG